MSIIEGRDLKKVYGNIQAIHNLSFTIEENTITGLIGRNGAGKTTLLRMIAGHLKPTQGAIRVFDRNPFEDLTVAGNMIFVDDTMVFPYSFTLGDLLKEAEAFYPNWSSQIAEGLFDYFRLNPQQRHGNLSKGSKSIFNAIIGIAARCPLTLMDEPTTGMDSAVRKDFYRALLKDYLDHPRTIILSSHLLGELEEILEDILLLDQGAIRLHSSVLEMKESALGFRGNAQVIREGLLSHLGHEGILYQEEFARGSVYLVVRTEHLPQGYEKVRTQGVEVVPVDIDDLCIYLTAKTKGGIDDVFKRN